jgi:hypothetical protein
MDTFTRARPAEGKMSAATGRGALVPAGLVGAGISLIVVVGLNHSFGDVQQVTDFYTQISTLLVKLVEAGNGLEPRPVEGGHRTWEA